MILTSLFLAGLVLCVLSASIAFGALRRHRESARAALLPDFAPPVSIVKPLEGLDDELEENLESFFRLDYRDYEIVFSFAREEDPAFEVARRVADRHPERAATFVIDRRQPDGNAKVHRLLAGVARARHPTLLFSDGNVRVPSDFLTRAVSWLADPAVGLVSHLFRATGARSLGSRIESLYLNGSLRAGTAAVTRLVRMPCVVGKSILVSRPLWNAIGGLAPLTGFLAEDFLLGQAARRAGYRVVLSADQIETREVSRTPGAAWARHRRWAILRSSLGGPAYLAEALASPAGWFAGLVCAGADSAALLLGAACWLSRIALEALSSADAREPFPLSDWLLAPIRDVAVALLFWAGLFGRTTTWRGRRIRVGRGTRIERLPGGRPRALPRLAPGATVEASAGRN